MRISQRLLIAVTAVVVLWVGFGYAVSRPPDAGDYQRTMVQVAESAHDAAVTGALTGRQQLDDRVFDAFAGTAYDDATETVAAAAQKLASQAPPDARSAALRDRVAPLVQATVHHLGDAAGAADDAELRIAVSGLNDVAERLSDLIEPYQ